MSAPLTRATTLAGSAGLPQGAAAAGAAAAGGVWARAAPGHQGQGGAEGKKAFPNDDETDI